MEFLKQTRCIPKEFRRTGPRGVARAVTYALMSEGGRSVGVRLDRSGCSPRNVSKPINDSYLLFDTNPAPPNDTHAHGNTATRLLLRVVVIPADDAVGDHGPLIVVAQPVSHWEWLSYDKLEEPSEWVLSPASVMPHDTTASNQTAPVVAVMTLDMASPPLKILAGDLDGPEKDVCDAFDQLCRQVRERILSQFPQCISAVSQVDQNQNCEPDCAETVLVRRPPFPEAVEVSRLA